jgi:hypothetical protein
MGDEQHEGQYEIKDSTSEHFSERSDQPGNGMANAGASASAVSQAQH